jgi:RNA polymerase sigma-70 factor, ECF subfamily
MLSDSDDLDEALALAKQGDEMGFGRLWRALHPRLLRYLRVVGCEDPDDVAGETWLHVVRDLHAFSGSEKEFRRWLFTIGRNRAIDAARARSRRPVTPVSTGLEVVPDEQRVEDDVLEGISTRRALTLVAGLPADQAEAVALRVIAGLDTAHVAQLLGKSTGSVRVALHRGLKTLAADPDVRSMAGPALPPGRPAGVGTHSGADTASRRG